MLADGMKMRRVTVDHGIAREDVFLFFFFWSASPSFFSRLSFVNTVIKETSGYQVLIVLLIYTYN